VTCAPSRHDFTIAPIPTTQAANAIATTLNETTPLLFRADANIRFSSLLKDSGGAPRLQNPAPLMPVLRGAIPSIASHLHFVF
jgi:hypothetical protein